MRSIRIKFLTLTIVATLMAGGLAQADIYVFVDKNGTRHISNKPDDNRYKLVMRTPTYKQPGPEITKVSPQDGAVVQIVAPATDAAADASRWKVITPNSTNPRDTLANLSGPNYLKWGKGQLKSFGVNEKNRRRFSAHIARMAARYRLDPNLLHAVISTESAFNPDAVSHAGAMGLMQLMPATAERFGVKDPFDPIANVRGGAKYLSWLMKRFKNLRLALAGYNAGENAVAKYGNKIPPYKETQNYVKRVMRFYSHYRGTKS